MGMAVAYKNIPAKSDFFQMHPNRSGFDFECRVLRADLILNEFEQIGLIGRLIPNAPTQIRTHG